jgi:hypothetical protein
MTDGLRRPVLVLLTIHWISMLGVALVTIAPSRKTAAPAMSRSPSMKQLPGF